MHSPIPTNSCITFEIQQAFTNRRNVSLRRDADCGDCDNTCSETRWAHSLGRGRLAKSVFLFMKHCCRFQTAKRAGVASPRSPLVETWACDTETSESLSAWTETVEQPEQRHIPIKHTPERLSKQTSPCNEIPQVPGHS